MRAFMTLQQNEQSPTGRRVRRARVTGGALSTALLGLWLPLAPLACSEPAWSAEPAAAAAPESELTPAALLDDLDSTAKAKQARLERLRQQMQQLREESRRVKPKTAPVPLPPAAAPAPHAATDIPTAKPADLESQTPHSDAAASDLTAPAHQHASPGDVPVPHPPDGDSRSGHAHPVDHPHAKNSGEVVVGASINRLAFADSLFATGRTDLALQAYSAIELVKLPVIDRYWIEYQVANCHRRMGNMPEAEQRYRHLAGLVDAGWCAAHARWWLDALSSRAVMQRDLSQVRETMKSIEEQLNAAPTK